MTIQGEGEGECPNSFLELYVVLFPVSCKVRFGAPAVIEHTYYAYLFKNAYCVSNLIESRHEKERQRTYL